MAKKKTATVAGKQVASKKVGRKKVARKKIVKRKATPATQSLELTYGEIHARVRPLAELAGATNTPLEVIIGPYHLRVGHQADPPEERARNLGATGGQDEQRAADMESRQHHQPENGQFSCRGVKRYYEDSRQQGRTPTIDELQQQFPEATRDQLVQCISDVLP